MFKIDMIQRIIFLSMQVNNETQHEGYCPEEDAVQIDSGNNKPYIRLESTSNKKGSITAKVEIDVQRGKNIKREFLTVEDGDELEQITNRAIYENMQIGTITCGKGTLHAPSVSPKSDH